MARGEQQETGLRDPKILLPFILITLIWSSTWIVIKDQLGPVPPPWSVAYRFVIAAAAMFFLAWVTGAGLRLGRGGHPYALAIGVPQFVLNFNFVYAAEHYVTSGLVAVVFALLIVPNAVLARLLFGRQVSGRFLIGSAVALVGVALLFLQELRGTAVPNAATLAGIGLTLCGVLAASAGNVLQLAPEVQRRPIPTMLAWAMLYGALANAGFAWAGWGPPVIEARLGYWFGLLYLSLAASALAFFFYYRILRAIGPAKAAYSSVLVPIVAMAISTVAEDYHWSALAIAGGLLAMTGLIIALRSGRIASPAPSD
jgi:drug/metabolite transporter (DMT)-like permease